MAGPKARHVLLEVGGDRQGDTLTREHLIAYRDRIEQELVLRNQAHDPKLPPLGRYHSPQISADETCLTAELLEFRWVGGIDTLSDGLVPLVESVVDVPIEFIRVGYDARATLYWAPLEAELQQIEIEHGIDTSIQPLRMKGGEAESAQILLWVAGGMATFLLTVLTKMGEGFAQNFGKYLGEKSGNALRRWFERATKAAEESMERDGIRASMTLRFDLRADYRIEFLMPSGCAFEEARKRISAVINAPQPSSKANPTNPPHIVHYLWYPGFGWKLHTVILKDGSTYHGEGSAGAGMRWEGDGVSMEGTIPPPPTQPRSR